MLCYPNNVPQQQLNYEITLHMLSISKEGNIKAHHEHTFITHTGSALKRDQKITFY